MLDEAPLVDVRLRLAASPVAVEPHVLQPLAPAEVEVEEHVVLLVGVEEGRQEDLRTVAGDVVVLEVLLHVPGDRLEAKAHEVLLVEDEPQEEVSTADEVRGVEPIFVQLLELIPGEGDNHLLIVVTGDNSDKGVDGDAVLADVLVAGVVVPVPELVPLHGGEEEVGLLLVQQGQRIRGNVPRLEAELLVVRKGHAGAHVLLRHCLCWFYSMVEFNFLFYSLKINFHINRLSREIFSANR